MFRKIGLLFVTVVAFSSWAECETPPVPLSPYKDFVVLTKTGSLPLGEEISDFETILGSAKGDQITENEATYTKYSWEGLDAFCIGTKVVSIRIRAPWFSTPRGLKPGATLSDVKSLYGKPEKLKKNYYYFSVVQDSVWELAIITDSGQKVKEIRMNVGD